MTDGNSSATTTSVPFVSPGVGEATALKCRLCKQAFGGAVAYCPFCGTNQAGEAATKPASLSVPAVSNQQTMAPNSAPLAPNTAAAETTLPPVKSPKTGMPHGAPQRRSAWLQTGLLVAALALGVGVAGKFLRRVNTRLTMMPVGAQIVVTSTPLADGVVSIDGRDEGQPGQTRSVTAGTHYVSLLAPGWKPASKKVYLEPGQRSNVTLVLQSTDAPDTRPGADTSNQQVDEPRQIEVLAPPVGWSTAVSVVAGDVVQLFFRGRIHVRLNGPNWHILPFSGDESTLTVSRATVLQISSIEDHAIRVALIIRHGPDVPH